MSGVDPGLIRAWLAARSLVRGLPAPIDDRGGWRVDSDLPEEAKRYLFAARCEGLRDLGREIEQPRIALKLCARGDSLLAELPPRWQLTSEPETCVMIRDLAPDGGADLPQGYELALQSNGAITFARVRSEGEEVATGYAAEWNGVFIYDRIVVSEPHRRRGLGRALIAALGRNRRFSISREILTATGMGRSLYLTIGWREYCPYSTAMIKPV